jgi:hypothetical protein
MEYGKLGNTDIEELYVPHEIVGAIDKIRRKVLFCLMKRNNKERGVAI